MIVIEKKGILLSKTHLDFENEAVSNPAAIKEGNTVHLFYRAVSIGNISSIGYCRLEGPSSIQQRDSEPIIFAESGNESHGVEDPRIVKIDDLYFLTYTAYDGVNALGALATSTDLRVFKKHGIIVPQISYDQFEVILRSRADLNDRYSPYFSQIVLQGKMNKSDFIWDKDLLFFPRRINGKLFFLHRIKPDIQIVAIDDLSDLTPEFWNNYIYHIEENTFLRPKYSHEIVHIGGGAPPIETALGWVIIYHGIHLSPEKERIYCACVALFDINDPWKEITRLPYPLFKPEYSWELEGEVNNVCFPCGTSLFGDDLTIYYGAADEQIAYASISLSALLAELTLNTKQHEN